MRGLMTEAAALAYVPLSELPRRQDPMADVPRADWADGIWWICAWCRSDNRVILMDPMRPGQSVTDYCAYCGGLTQITRRVAMFA